MKKIAIAADHIILKKKYIKNQLNPTNKISRFWYLLLIL